MKKSEHALNNKESLNSLKNLYSRGWELVKSEKYEDVVKALPYFLDALSISEKLDNNKDEPYTAQILFGMSYTYRMLEGTDNYLKALDYCQRSFAMFQTYYGNVAHEQIARCLDLFGEIYGILGDEASKLKRVEYTTEALEMWQKLHQGQAHPIIVRSLHAAAIAYQDLDNDEALGKSTSLLEQTLSMAKSLYGEQPNIEVARILNTMAINCHKLGDLESINKALCNFQESLAIHQELNGSVSVDVALALGNIGASYYYLTTLDQKNKQKYLASYLEYTEKAFNVNQELYGNHSHPDLEKSAQELSMAYLRVGNNTDIKQAYQLQQQALKMCQELYTQDHPNTLKCLDILNYIVDISPELRSSIDGSVAPDDHILDLKSLSNQMKEDEHPSSQYSVLQETAQDSTELMGHVNDKE